MQRINYTIDSSPAFSRNNYAVYEDTMTLLIKDLITFIKKNLKTYLSTIYNQELSLGICANRQVWRRNILSY